MDPNRWIVVKRIFHEALERPAECRAAFVREACGADAGLRLTVESMLAREPDAAGFLESPALEVEARALARDLDGRQAPRQAVEPASGGGLSVRELRSRGEPGLPAVRRRRPPWWMYLLAVVFLTDAVLRAWGWVAGPTGLGLTARDQDGHWVVTAVSRGSPADAAGLLPGDIIAACGAYPCDRVMRPRLAQPNLQVGQTFRLDVVRDGHPDAVALVIQRWHPRSWRAPGAHVFWQLAMFAMLATALLIAFARPRDRRARLGALMLASLGLSLYTFYLPPGYAATVRAVPWGLGALAAVSNLAVALVGPIGLTFFLSFPRKVVRSRWPWLLVWLPVLLNAPAYAQAMLIVYRPDSGFFLVRDAPEWVHRTSFGVFAAYGLAMLAAILVSYLRLTDSNEKRRLRILVAGGALGAFPGLARVAVQVVAPRSALREFLMTGWPDIPIAIGFLLFPTSFAYAVLRHRVLGVRVIIRLGVQFALAKGLVISLVPLLGVLLIGDALVHGDQPLIEIVRTRGWPYGLIAGLAALVHSQRRRLGGAIDRRFFREHYDAGRLLRDIVRQERRAGSLERAAPAVVSRLELALRPEFAALLFRPAGAAAFRCLAAAPAGQAPGDVAADDPAVARLRALDRPIVVRDTEADAFDTDGGPPQTDGEHRPVLHCWCRLSWRRRATKRCSRWGRRSRRSRSRARTSTRWRRVAPAWRCSSRRGRRHPSVSAAHSRSARNAGAATTPAPPVVRTSRRHCYRWRWRGRWPAGTGWSGGWGAAGWGRCTRPSTPRWIGGSPSR